MFGIIAELLTTVLTVLFPIFASYKALRTSDPAQTTPWLMYWVVLGLVLQVESFFDFILSWVPFYSWMRLFLHLYLVMPGKQGATQIYEDHIDPFLTHHEVEIDRLIGDAHKKATAAGLKYAQSAIEWVRVNVLGMQPKPPSPPQSRNSSATYTQTLLSRFAIPSARPSAGSGPAGDVYSLISQALTGATALYGSRDAQAANLSASGTLIPRDIPAEERTSYVNTQRDRLRVLLQAFDREAYALSPDQDRHSNLSKSKSEAEFDRIEVSEADDRYGGRTPGSPSGPGAWMPWNWGQGPPPPREPEDDRRRYRDERDERDDRGDRYERGDHRERPYRYERDERHGRSSGFDVGY